MKAFDKFLVKIAAVVLLAIFSAGCGDDSSTADHSNNTLDWNKKIAAAYVHSYAVCIGAAVLEFAGDSVLSRFIRNSIDPISFYPDSSGYFYVYDFDCVNIAHARQKELQGQNLYNYTDTRGKFVIRELSAMAKSGGGFVEYYWIKPGVKGEKQKLGYVEPIPNTNYFIGTGVYLE